MRIPRKPPADVIAADPQRLLQAVQKHAVGMSYRARYLHWDKMRHLQPPEGVTSQEWWHATRLARRLNSRVLPFEDVAGTPMRFCIPDQVTEYLHHIDQKAGGQMDGAEVSIANPVSRDRYLFRSIAEEAITSSQLEGAATTRVVAKEMLRAGRPPRDRSERMIFNNFRTMRHILRVKDQPLDMALLLELHRMLTEETLDDPSAIGRLRNTDEAIHVRDAYGQVLHEPPPAEHLPRRLEKLFAFANGATPDYYIHPVLRAIILHFMLAYEHPFVDGNGRCARALFYWAMLRQGAWLCEFLSISAVIRRAPAKYGRAFLYTETDENDVTYFLLYHLEAIHKAIEELHAHIHREADQARHVEGMLRHGGDFNHRQLAVLGHALRHPHAEYLVQTHKTSHGISTQTARTDLEGLVSRGLLTTRKLGRAVVYQAPGNLENRLRNLNKNTNEKGETP